MNSEKKVLLFDFDGVLVNTIEHAYNIHKKLNDHFLWEEYENMSDDNFHAGYKKILETGRHVHPENFQDEYNKGLVEMTLEQELAQLVSRLSEMYRLYIVSSSMTSYIQDFLKKADVLDSFAGILGYDVHSSKVIKVKSILEKEQVLPQQCLFVTDTTGDIKEARECEVRTIGVSWGLHKRERLEQQSPFAVVDTPQELYEKIDAFFARI